MVARRCRGGWTLVELLVVVGVMGIVLALVLPAVLAAREMARRTECRSNLRHLGMALQAFENVREAFPPGAVTGSDPTEVHGWLRLTPGPAHNWATFVLPYLDQPGLDGAYDWSSDWRAAVNRSVRESALGVLTCPSTPDRTRWEEASASAGGWRAVAGDYAPDYGIDPSLPHPSVIDVVSSHRPRGALVVNEVNYPSRITDGLSNTLCLTEDAGRPRRYGPQGKLLGGTKVSGAGWANPQGPFVTDGSSSTLGGGPGHCPLNCSNDNEIYAFHPGGANALMADGSVRFLATTIELRCLARLITRAGGEPLSDSMLP